MKGKGNGMARGGTLDSKQLWILASWIRRVITVAGWLQIAVTLHLEGLAVQHPTTLTCP